MPTRARISIGLAVAAALTVGCAEPFDTPPAYESSRYLCDDASAGQWQALVDECRTLFEDREACAGVMSFAGTLEGQDVVVESLLTDTTFRDRLRLDATTVRSRVTAIGLSDYFQFSVDYKKIGGDINMGDQEHDLAFGFNPDPLADEYTDEYAEATLRITNAGRSIDLVAQNGAVSFSRQLPQEQAGSFSGAFGSNTDFIDGCFHLFPTELELTQETTP